MSDTSLSRGVEPYELTRALGALPGGDRAQVKPSSFHNVRAKSETENKTH